MRRHRHGTGGEAGTTLIELLLAVVMLGVVVMGIFYLWSYNQQAYMQGSEAAEVQQYARAAMEQLSREIRLAGYDPCRYVVPKANPMPVGATTTCLQNTDANATTRTAFGPGRLNSQSISNYTATGLTIRMDRNVSGEIEPATLDPAEVVTFSYAGGVISRTAGNGAAQELARSITNFSLEYFQASPTQAIPAAATQWDNIAMVRITLVARQMLMGSPVQVTLTSDVKLRDR